MIARIKHVVLAAGFGLLFLGAIPALAAGVAPGVHAPAANAEVRLVHLAPFAKGNATAVTVTLDSTPLITNFVYGQSTAYVPVPGGTYEVHVYRGAVSTPIITQTVVLTGGLNFTAIAVGNSASKTYRGFKLDVLQDDLTPPPSGDFKIRIGHLAPFSTTLAGTKVDVRLQDGSPIPGLQGIEYGQVSPTYLPLAAGKYDFKITAPGGKPTLIDPAPQTFAAGSILSLFATGDETHQPLGVFALPSDALGSFLPLMRPTYLPIIFKNAP